MAQQQHRSTARVLEILSLLASSTEGFTLNELSKFLDAPRTSLYPIVQTMLMHNFIAVNKDDGRYRIGYNAYVTGAPFLEQRGAYGVLLEEMRKIADSCGEMCQLGVLDGVEVLYIGKVESPAAIRTVSHVGKKLPIYCTALGKALVHQLSWEELQVFLPQPLVSYTPNTIISLEKLHEQLHEICETGVAHEVEETQEGIQCLAIPICKDGRTIFAISLTIPVFRMTAQLREHCVDCLLIAKKRLETMLLDMSLDNAQQLL